MSTLTRVYAGSLDRNDYVTDTDMTMAELRSVGFKVRFVIASYLIIIPKPSVAARARLADMIAVK